MAQYLSQQGRSHLASSESVQNWEESTSSFPKFSCSTSYLVYLPIFPTWPISVYLKHDWQNTDNSPAPLMVFWGSWFMKESERHSARTQQIVTKLPLKFPASWKCLWILWAWRPKMGAPTIQRNFGWLSRQQDVSVNSRVWKLITIHFLII